MIAHKRVGDKWSSDELYFRAARYKTAWLFGVMDLDNRYIIDHDASDSKQGYDATELYRSAVSTAGKKPQFITTDSLTGLARGIRKIMGDDTVHIKDAGINKVHANNNTYERFNGILKQRFRLARGFGSLHPGLHYIHCILQFVLSTLWHWRPDASREALHDNQNYWKDHLQVDHSHKARSPVLCIGQVNYSTGKLQYWNV